MFDRIIDIFNHVFWFFLLNLFFMLFNIPLLLFFTTVGISNVFNYLPVFLLCLIPVMPTFTALLYCMRKLLVNKGLSLMKDFIKGIKSNFIQALIIWSAELLIFLILFTNIRFFSSAGYGLILVILFISITIVLIAVTPFVFMLISRFQMSHFEIIKTAFILCFTRPVLTITNLLILVVALVLFEIAPGTTILFISSLLALAFTYVNRVLFHELEEVSNK